jgi:hypothetical protein
MIDMVITYVGLMNVYKSKLNTVNMDFIVANSKNYHLSYTHTLFYIHDYYLYKTQNKASLNSNAQCTTTSARYK